jgi:hypothetical protein
MISQAVVEAIDVRHIKGRSQNPMEIFSSKVKIF